MYATHTKESYWIKIIGELPQNKHLEYSSGNTSFNIGDPSYNPSFYQNHRWKKFINSVLQSHAGGHTQKTFAQYICAQQPKIYTFRFKTVNLYKLGKTLEESGKYSAIPAEMIYSYNCYLF